MPRNTIKGPWRKIVYLLSGTHFGRNLNILGLDQLLAEILTYLSLNALLPLALRFATGICHCRVVSLYAVAIGA